MNKTSIAQQAKTTSFLAPAQGILQRKCACGNHTVAGADCVECAKKKQTLQRATLSPRGRGLEGEGVVPPIVHEVIRSPGQPLDPATRTFMESRLKHDLGHVRVHTNERAGESAEAVNALAYTAGRHVVFGAGQYLPSIASGRRLLAHELAHSVQQGFAPNPLPQLVGDSHSSLERQADETANRVINNVSLPSTDNTISSASIVQTTLLQREEVLIPEINLPSEKEEIYVRQTSTARETVPPDCKENSLILSWEEDTCCSNRGFPDPAAKHKTAGKECCNTFPRFVDSEATNRGFDGAASCKPEYKEHSATVTPNDKSKSVVKVICTDTRANNNNVIELGEKAAVKAFGNTRLRERGKVCYGNNKEPGTCYVPTDCNETVNPKESQCLSAGCSKTDTAGSAKKQDKPKK